MLRPCIALRVKLRSLSIELLVAQPCRQTSRNKTSCCDLGMEPQKVWLEKTDGVVRRGVGKKEYAADR